MTEQHLFRSDDELAAALESLGRQIVYPATPDLTGAVRRGIQMDAPSPVRRFPLPRRLLAVAATLLVVLIGGVLILPETRSTVAGWFGVPGIGIWFGDAPEEVTHYGEPLDLGDQVTLEEARDAAGFEVLVPDVELLGEPDEVYVNSQFNGTLVSFIYHTDDRIPETEQTGVGVLLTQFQGYLNPGMYGKGAPAGVQVTDLEINGHAAYWLSGEPHTFSWRAMNGSSWQDHIRMAGNTLLWQDGEITFRLESALDRDAVLSIAGSMR